MQVPEVGVVEVKLEVAGAVVGDVVEAGNIKVNKGNYHKDLFIF